MQRVESPPEFENISYYLLQAYFARFGTRCNLHSEARNALTNLSAFL
jgi:hypothetical protein